MSLALLSGAFLGACVGNQGQPEATPTGAPAPPTEQNAPASAAPTAATSVAPRAVNAGSCPANGLVDDFEDGNNRAEMVEGRGGYWYTYADPSSTVEPSGGFAPTPGGAGESAFSGGMKGSVGAQQYPFVGIGVSLTDPKAPYDVSCCQGVSFKGKKIGDGIAAVRLKVGDWQTTPEGGACQQCYNDFGADLLFSDEWQEFTLKFSEMRQEPYWGEPKPALDTQAVFQLQWQVKENNRPFELQVDDVRFFGCGEAG